MRRSLTWLFALPLVLAGSQVAHVLAYRWVYPSSHVRLHALVESGHGYMAQLPLVLGIGAAIAFVSLLAAIVDAARGRSLHGLPAWAFALLPVLTFVVQEILERSLHTGTFVWQATESPTFLPGLALQLPFAALAFVIARLLLRTANAVGRLIGAARTSAFERRPPDVLRLPIVVRLPHPAPLSARAAGRAPPLFAR
ncbi:MAG: hypothetical protein ACTHKS_18320 [Gaiellaceae bacterium]